ncbi:hypothetical protein S1OALGB6SA_131 [Olavius algarvensis spirochete endosymbiont]|nr:hypothetical protein S1OALGB6SA_131 [Olavius algarvensis spirochete endosymbiont]
MFFGIPIHFWVLSGNLKIEENMLPVPEKETQT